MSKNLVISNNELLNYIKKMNVKDLSKFNNVYGSIILIGGGFYDSTSLLHAAEAASYLGLEKIYVAAAKPIVESYRSINIDLIYIPLPDYKLTHGCVSKLSKLYKKGIIDASNALIGFGLKSLNCEEYNLAHILYNKYNVQIVFDFISNKCIDALHEIKKAIIVCLEDELNVLLKQFSISEEGIDNYVKRLVSEYDISIVILSKFNISILANKEQYIIATPSRSGFKFFEKPILTGLIGGFLSKMNNLKLAILGAVHLYIYAVNKAFNEYGCSYTSNDIKCNIRTGLRKLLELSNQLYKS